MRNTDGSVNADDLLQVLDEARDAATEALTHENIEQTLWEVDAGNTGRLDRAELPTLLASRLRHGLVGVFDARRMPGAGADARARAWEVLLRPIAAAAATKPCTRARPGASLLLGGGSAAAQTRHVMRLPVGVPAPACGQAAPEPNEGRPFLVLNFDVNQTIIMLDSVAGYESEHPLLNRMLANAAWGTAASQTTQRPTAKRAGGLLDFASFATRAEAPRAAPRA